MRTGTLQELPATRDRLPSRLVSFCCCLGFLFNTGFLHNLGEGELGGGAGRGQPVGRCTQAPGGSAGMSTAPAVKKSHSLVLVSVSQASRQELSLEEVVHCLGSLTDKNKPAEASGAFVTGAHRGHCSSTGGSCGGGGGGGGTRGDGEGGPQATAGCLGKAHPDDRVHGRKNMVSSCWWGGRGHRPCLHGAFCSTFKSTRNP